MKSLGATNVTVRTRLASCGVKPFRGGFCCSSSSGLSSSDADTEEGILIELAALDREARHREQRRESDLSDAVSST